MPRGGWQIFKRWRSGPKRTLQGVDEIHTCLEDVTHRLADLEMEADAAVIPVANQRTITVAAIRNGQAVYFQDVIVGEVNAL